MSGTVELERPGGAGGNARARTVMSGSWRPIPMLLSSLTWRSAIYLAASMFVGLAWFIGLAVGGTLSVAMVIIWVGIPMLALIMIGWRGASILERQLVRAAFGIKIPSPYRPMPSGYNVLRKWRTLVADPATWKDLLFLILRFPIGIVELVVSAAVWTAAGTFLFLPVIALATGDQGVLVGFGDYAHQIDDPVEALPWTVVGAAFLMVAMYVVRVMAVGHALYATYLLGPSPAQLEARRLRARADRLQASRARGVDAAESERRRIERDLHDGAQQRLLAVAMDIGRARAKLDDDPKAARALIEQAHTGTKEAIAELRDLARGIYPAILTDRGLDPALSSLAARAPVPVEVNVDLPERPPAAVESIAYFIVAESLANIAKYARATRANVRVDRDENWVVVEVIDNGVGGAVATPGGGLGGLADRAATIDGMLIVDSPPGGPTIIRADLPCTW